jgi:hypothetical protein
MCIHKYVKSFVTKKDITVFKCFETSDSGKLYAAFYSPQGKWEHLTSVVNLNDYAIPSISGYPFNIQFQDRVRLNDENFRNTVINVNGYHCFPEYDHAVKYADSYGGIINPTIVKFTIPKNTKVIEGLNTYYKIKLTVFVSPVLTNPQRMEN